MSIFPQFSCIIGDAMIMLIFFLICVFVTMGIGVLAGIADFRAMTIPNHYSVYVIALFVLAYGVMALGGGAYYAFKPIQWHLASAGLMFVVTFAMFGLRLIGAGDSKFASACALWVSLRDLPAFIFYMTIMGALLGVAALVMRRRKPFANAMAGGWVDQVQNGASKVPYGIAISFGMIIAFVQAGYFSPDVLSHFVASAAGGQAS